MTSLSVHHCITWLVGGECCEKMKFVVFEMWWLERLTNFPKWRPLNSWCMKVLSSEGFSHGKLVGAPRHNLIGWWGVLWKNEIRGFWDVRVGNAYKCPQMNTMKFLVHENFEFGGVCTWPRLSVHHGIARLVGWEFLWKNEIRGFWDVRVGNSYKCPQMNTMKILVHESFEFRGFCTWPRLVVHDGIGGLVGSFVKKWNSWFFRYEGWKGLQMSPNEYHEILGARKFGVRRVCHLAKLVGA